ncbi:tRNA(fMet)-specific endonuclease VapC [Phycisphaera mikurensis]|nr:tRNA(fMet)-specific endonuclease VapC [Phycisphaera mikurensis]
MSEIVKAELLQGARLAKDPERDLERMRSLFALYPSHPFDEPVAEQWARVNAPLRRAGTPIGPFDAAIAATALVHGCTVVTHNWKHFDLVPGLAVEDWEAEEAA